MSLIGITSSAFLDSTAQSRMQQLRGEFQQLGKDLSSGNLSGAQTDFASLFPSSTNSTSSTSPSGSKTTLSDDFKKLSQDLQTGDVSSAQQDYSKIQQDFQSSMTRGHPHHHHGGGGGGGQVSQLFQQVGQSLQSGDLAGAQQAYAALQQQFQQFQAAGLALNSTAQPGSGLSVNA